MWVTYPPSASQTFTIPSDEPVASSEESGDAVETRIGAECALGNWRE